MGVMRVGLPRALLYHRYGKFWERFLAELGCEVVLSRKTDRVLLQNGLECVSSEVCLPIKIAAGHVMELADKVDAIFLPRMMWLDDKLYACPKMIGIVDAMRMTLAGRTRLVAPGIRGDFMFAHFRAGMQLTRNPLRVMRALARSRGELGGHADGFKLEPGGKRVALIGHFYNLGDEFISRHIIDAFRSHGYEVVCKDDLPQAVLSDRRGFACKIRWVYERELYNAFRYLVDKVSGVCVVVSMGCGPDSLVAEFMREEATERRVPFLQLVMDEHTGVAGLVTRIEAFVELAERAASLKPPPTPHTLRLTRYAGQGSGRTA